MVPSVSCDQRPMAAARVTADRHDGRRLRMHGVGGRFYRGVMTNSDLPDRGSVSVSDENAPGWWTLADPEGNEADLAIWG